MNYINIQEKETHDYMKDTIDNCATEMISKITNYEEHISVKIKELENNLVIKIIKYVLI